MGSSVRKKRRLWAGSPLKTVWASISADNYWGREILRGATTHARISGWLFQHYSVDDAVANPGALAVLGLLPDSPTGPFSPVDGIIARVANASLAQLLHRARVPTVNISNQVIEGPEFPRVNIDLDACASLAADHFTDLGVRSFLYVGHKGMHDAERQHAAFAARLGRHPTDTPASWYAGEPIAWANDLIRIASELPKPLGVFARFMTLTQRVALVLMASGVHVPENVTLLSGDDDPLLADMATPTISAIDVNAERIGTTAAEVLDDLMAGRAAPRKPIRIPPVGIISRGSTDLIVTTSPEVAAAIRYIRANVARPIHIDDLAREARLSQRMLYRTFHEELGRSPLQQIQRIRLAQAQSLLAAGNVPLERVARMSGFGNARYMARVFMKELGKPPSAFRRSGA